MNDDILIKAIEETAKEFVKDYVNVYVKSVYDGSYELILEYSGYHTAYQLDKRYEKRKSYIMDVVNRLCQDLAKHFNKGRNFFFKRNYEKKKNRL